MPLWISRVGPPPSDEQASFDELRSAVGQLESQVAELRSLLEEQAGVIAARDARIKELEKLLEDSRRSGKRQAAPFSKGNPVEEPRTPGRKSGKRHGRHGHRMAPSRVDRELSAPLPGCCPDCGGEIEHLRDATQFQTELPDARPVVTRFTIGVGRCKSAWNSWHPAQGEASG